MFICSLLLFASGADRRRSSGALLRFGLAPIWPVPVYTHESPGVGCLNLYQRGGVVVSGLGVCSCVCFSALCSGVMLMSSIGNHTTRWMHSCRPRKRFVKRQSRRIFYRVHNTTGILWSILSSSMPHGWWVYCATRVECLNSTRRLCCPHHSGPPPLPNLEQHGFLFGFTRWTLFTCACTDNSRMHVLFVANF